MKFPKFWIVLFSLISFNLLMANKTFAQCEEIASNYQNYMITHSLNLDPIEGVWKVYRTVKIYKNNRLSRVKKDVNAQTWTVLKSNQNFLVCTGNKNRNEPELFFTKQDKSSYVFNKNYIKQQSMVSAFANLQNAKLTFKFFENGSYLMDLLGDKYVNGLAIEYDYELVKEENYASKVVNEVPKIKNFIIDGVKNYFNVK